MDVIGLGALNIDELFLVDELIKDDEIVVNSSIVSCGGSAANTIYALAKLGLKAGFIGVVGDDSQGAFILKDFKSQGVDISKIRKVKNQPTGKALGFVDKKGKRSLYILVGANLYLTQEDIDFSYINQAKVLHMSSLKGKIDLQSYAVSKLKDSLILSFAPGAVLVREGLAKLSQILKRVNILFLNSKELFVLTQEKNIETAFLKLLDYGVETIVLTQGESPTIIRTKENTYHIPCEFKVEVVKDTTGAGDAYAGGFLFGLIKGYDLVNSARLGHLVASYSIQGIGARSNLPTYEQLITSYKKYSLE
jgi:ribokinase